jgi:hypothetical protein
MNRKLIVTCLVAAIAALGVSPALAQAEFGITSVEGSLNGPDGSPLLQAGAHPDLTTTIHFTTSEDPEIHQPKPDADPKDIDVDLPPGVIGDPSATPKCSQANVAAGPAANCDPNDQVGVATITTYFFGPTPTEVPIYNLEPPLGVAGQFAFNIDRNVVYINAGVTMAGEYRLSADISNISQGLPLGDTSVTLWGNPPSPIHDADRALRGGSLPPLDPETFEPITVPSTAPERPLIDNPTACTGTPLRTDVSADSWQAPGALSFGSSDHDPAGIPLVITGCDALEFEASMKVQPTTTEAESPTGLNVELTFPQNDWIDGLSTSHLRDADVVLPEGMAVDPSSAGGLGSCTPDQIKLGNDDQPTCPASSKIGSVEVESPLVDHPLEGGVYLAQQGQNKFGSLLALYLVVDDPVSGVLLKIPGKIETDPTTGRLTARFDDDPQMPIEALQMKLFGGPRASLLTPPACGTYTTRGEFTPWSGGAPVVRTDSFTISGGPEGQPCPSGRFDPSFQAGTATSAAGQYSPFEVRIARTDGSSRLSGVSVQLPKGLLAKLAGIPYCSDQALGSVPTGEGTGAAQLASPSCPAASKVGTVAVAAGAGQSPFWAKTGSAYLAGPYKGAPLSLAVITPAVAGPFDLGNVVVRVALHVDPETAQVTADSDPLPTILSGIPLDLREVRVTLDRQDFTLNPTSCAQSAVSAVLTSTGGATASPSSRFAAAGCEGLGFAPKLALSLKGGTHRGAYPQLTAKLNAQPGQANLARVAVQLPRSEFLAQGHIGTVCTRVQFAANQCPERSIYGYAEATTPLLSEPLRGPVYLRSSSHKLPDLVAALRGQIAIDLDGRIDSHNRGIRTTFETIPDAPISSFVLRMKGGKKSLLENSANICAKPGKAQVSMLGQNGAKHTTAPKLAAPCKKHH